MAILAIPAALCPDVVEALASGKQTKAFIILCRFWRRDARRCTARRTDSGNGEYIRCFADRAELHRVDEHVASQRIQSAYSAIELAGSRFDFQFRCNGSLYFGECGDKGLQFNSVWSVGNAKQIGVEDVLEYMDNTFDPEKDSRIKLLYIESIGDPDRLLFHASSLIKKGCKIAAIKAGSSESGSRAASSHTGAIASSDSAVEALFRKAGIVRCFSREELTTVGCVFTLPELRGRILLLLRTPAVPG